jgi:hypothetical protein
MYIAGIIGFPSHLFPSTHSLDLPMFLPLLHLQTTLFDTNRQSSRYFSVASGALIVVQPRAQLVGRVKSPRAYASESCETSLWKFAKSNFRLPFLSTLSLDLRRKVEESLRFTE